jgi:thiamine phosphate synthase YjbQ (UPF0047 family)
VKYVLQWVLDEDCIDEQADHRRAHLLQYLLVLVELSSQGDVDESRQRTKSFVQFLLKFVLFDSAKRLKPVLTAMGLSIPECVNRNNKMELWRYKTNAVEALVSNVAEGMNSVVATHASKKLALAAASKNPKKDPPQTLSKTLQVIAHQHWATDDFEEHNTASVVEVLQVLTCTPSSAGSADGTNLATTVAGATSDDDTHDVEASAPASAGNYGTDEHLVPSQIIAQQQVTIDFLHSEGSLLRSTVGDLARHLSNTLDQFEKGTLTPKTTQHMRELVHALSARIPEQSPHVALTVATHPTAASSSQDSARGQQVSPLTIPEASETSGDDDNNGFGISQNGLSLTEKGMLYCIQKLGDEGDDSKVHAIVRKSLVGEWAKKVADPQTDIERALAGCYWSLDDFEVAKVLGGGNYGRSMLVRLKTDPRIRFVMKVETFSYADFIKYFCGEAIEGSKVRHVNIIKTFGFFPVSTVCEKNKPICMALMQELGGDSLRGEVGSLEKLEPHEKFPQVINIMDGIIAAVHALERAGVVHRDIKLENIVMGEGGVPKLVDFGLARMYDEDDNMTENVGTGPYIPPEGHKVPSMTASVQRLFSSSS